MNLDELRAVRRKERQKDSLQHLRDSFYADVAEYIQTLKAERREAAQNSDDPFSSPEVSRLTDEIETAEEVVEAIYERRVGKVVKLSSFAAADMNADEEGLTAEERDLFEDLVGRIKRNRSTVLDLLGGEREGQSDAGGTAAGDAEDAGADPTPDTGTGPGVDIDVNPDAPEGAPSAAPPETPPQDTDAAASDAAPPEGDVLADAMGADAGGPAADAERPNEAAAADAPTVDESDPAAASETSGAASPASESGVADGSVEDRTTVRVTRDVGRIFGVDEREYELATEDVVTLPTPNAEPLIERDAAERIE